jgi:signal transduction histidine kinase
MRRMADLKELESAVGHDLNNVLQVVLGNLELLKRRREYVPATVEAALGATRQAADLADRLLALRRLHRPEVRPLDLNRLAADLAQVARETLGDAVRVETDLAANLPSVRADVRAVHVALRGTLRRSAISPKTSPSWSARTWAPPIPTSTSPLVTT